MAEAVLQRVEEERGRLLPSDVTMTITRNYGETAKEKSDELILHLIVATVSVVVMHHHRFRALVLIGIIGLSISAGFVYL